MTTPARLSYAGHRFPAEIISRAVWLYFRFPLSLRHVDENLFVESADKLVRCRLQLSVELWAGPGKTMI